MNEHISENLPVYPTFYSISLSFSSIMSFNLGEGVCSSSDMMAKSRNEIEIERLNDTRERKTERSSCQ